MTRQNPNHISKQGPSAGHPNQGWGRLPPPAFGQHSGQGSHQNTAFSHLLTVTWWDVASESKPHLEAYVGPGPNAGHPIQGWGSLPPPAFGQHSGQGRDGLQLNPPRVSEGNERYTGTRIVLGHVE